MSDEIKTINSEDKPESILLSLFKAGCIDNWFIGEEIFISIKNPHSPNSIIVNNPFCLNNFCSISMDINSNEMNVLVDKLSFRLSSFLIHFLLQNSTKNQCIILINNDNVTEVSRNDRGLVPLSQESLLLKSSSILTFDFPSFVSECSKVFQLKNENLIHEFLLRSQIQLNRALTENNQIFLKNFGCLVTGCTIEEAWFNGILISYACKTQAKLGSAINFNNIVMPNDRAKKEIEKLLIEGTSNVVLMNIHKTEIKWLAGELEFEAKMREMEYLDFKTGYDFKLKTVWK